MSGSDRPGDRFPPDGMELVIGVGDGGDLRIHGITRAAAVKALEHGESTSVLRDVMALCGTAALLGPPWYEFRRGVEELMTRKPTAVCRDCGWATALYRGTTGEELAMMTPSGADQAAMRTLGADPLLAVRTCEAVLVASAPNPSHPYWRQLLVHVTEHRPELVANEACRAGECGHADIEGCTDAATRILCPSCSVLTGRWAWERQAWLRTNAGGVPNTCKWNARVE